MSDFSTFKQNGSYLNVFFMYLSQRKLFEKMVNLWIMGAIRKMEKEKFIRTNKS